MRYAPRICYTISCPHVRKSAIGLGWRGGVEKRRRKVGVQRSRKNNRGLLPLVGPGRIPLTYTYILVLVYSTTRVGTKRGVGWVGEKRQSGRRLIKGCERSRVYTAG